MVAIEVVGYNINSYYLLDQPSFVQAEVVSGATVLAATGEKKYPFEAFVLKERNQKDGALEITTLMQEYPVHPSSAQEFNLYWPLL